MKTQEDKEAFLLNLDFYILDLPNGNFAVADPMDNGDGFYLELPDKGQLIDDSYTYWYNKYN